MSATYTLPTTDVESHIAWAESEGHTVKVYENESFVSVETITKWGSRDLDLFRKSDGKKITSFDDMKSHLASIIRKG
jgi:hypothetical protein